MGQQEVSSEELVKQTQNPVADLISVPFQNNFNFAAGPKHNHQIYLLNIQPVIPVHLNEDWNVIAQIITPVINLPSLAPGLGSATGLGDINPTFFLSPAKSGELIWGVGPTFYVADCHRQAPRKWKIQSGAGSRRADDEGALGVWRSYE